MARKRLGAAVRREAASDLLQSSFAEAVRREQLVLASRAAIEIVNLDAGADLEFVATFEVLPEIELADLGTLEVRKPATDIEEADIEAVIGAMRTQRMHWHSVDRPVAEQDRVVASYAVRTADETLTERENETLIVGDPRVFAELNNALPGMSVDETRVFPVSLDDAPPQEAEPAGAEHGVEAAAASEQPNRGDEKSERRAIGEATVHSVEAPSLPELDDSFFDQLGIERGGDRMQRFRATVRQRMQSEIDAAVRSQVRREVMSALVEAHHFELPQSMVDEGVAIRNRRMRSLMQNPGQEQVQEQEQRLDEWLDGAAESLRRSAEQHVSEQLIARAIITREAMQPDDERVRKRIDELASAYEDEAGARMPSTAARSS